MKSFARTLALSLTAASLGAVALHAQQPVIAYVRTGNVVFNYSSSFTSAIEGQNITIKYVNNEAPSKTVPQHEIEGGEVNANNGSSEIQSVGGLRFTNSAGNSVSMERLALESTTTAEADLTALVLVNGVYMGREKIFTVTSGPAFTFPIAYGQVSSTPISFQFTTKFSQELATDLSVPASTFTNPAGTFTVNLIIALQ